jgi:hypothetical protein
MSSYVAAIRSSHSCEVEAAKVLVADPGPVGTVTTARSCPLKGL